jgi:hypothetical protein
VPPEWTENLLQGCLGLRTGETVLILTDEPLRPAGEALCVAAKARGAASAALVTLPARPGLTVVPGALLRRVAAADVIISLLGESDCGREDPRLRAALAAFRAAGRGRWASGVHLTLAALPDLLGGDYAHVAARTARVAERLAGVRTVRIATPLGTDLTLQLGGRAVHQETGRLIHPGALSNLPPGEVYTAPLESGADGRLVVDLCIGDITLTAPVMLTFRQGRVVAVEGGPEVERLRRRLGADPWAWTIGEFGIGTNPWVRPRGKAAIDEKVAGTVHIALGGNRSFGGCNDAATHYDCVISRPQLYLDGVLVQT